MVLGLGGWVLGGGRAGWEEQLVGVWVDKGCFFSETAPWKCVHLGPMLLLLLLVLLPRVAVGSTHSTAVSVPLSPASGFCSLGRSRRSSSGSGSGSGDSRGTQRSVLGGAGEDQVPACVCAFEFADEEAAVADADVQGAAEEGLDVLRVAVLGRPLLLGLLLDSWRVGSEGWIFLVLGRWRWDGGGHGLDGGVEQSMIWLWSVAGKTVVTVAAHGLGLGQAC